MPRYAYIDTLSVLVLTARIHFQMIRLYASNCFFDHLSRHLETNLKDDIDSFQFYSRSNDESNDDKMAI